MRQSPCHIISINGSFGEGVANFGYASAMSVIVFIMVAILAFINLKVGDKRD